MYKYVQVYCALYSTVHITAWMHNFELSAGAGLPRLYHSNLLQVLARPAFITPPYCRCWLGRLLSLHPTAGAGLPRIYHSTLLQVLGGTALITPPYCRCWLAPPFSLHPTAGAGWPHIFHSTLYCRCWLAPPLSSPSPSPPSWWAWQLTTCPAPAY